MRRWGSRALFVTLMLIACARERPAKFAGGARSPEPEPTLPASNASCSPADLRPEPRKVLHGYASYYHDSLEGNPTASGAPYDPDAWSAAHRSLPFGTRLRVIRTDVRNAAPVCVVVNDRGPFAGRRRIVDLSRRAAEQLDMIGAGVVPVRVEVL